MIPRFRIPRIPVSSPDPITPFVQAIQGLAGRAPQMRADQMRNSARTRQMGVLDQMGTAAPVPQQKPAMGGGEALGLLISALLGKAAGANSSEVNDFVEGFTNARKAQADMRYQNEVNQYQAGEQQNRALQEAELGRARLDAEEADRLQGYVDRDRQRADTSIEKEKQRKSAAMSGVITRLSSDLDRAPYDRIPVIISQMNQAYREMGFPEMVIPQGSIDDMVATAKKNADEAIKAKAQDARTRLFRAIVPYATSEEERNKLSKWVSGMSESELDISLGKSEAELYQIAKRQTEDAMRPKRLQKMDADIQKVLGSAKLDDSRRRAVEQKISYYDDEFKLKMANTYSLIHQRSTGGGGGGGSSSYYGKGDETALKAGLNIARKTIAGILATQGAQLGQLTEQQKAALENAQKDAALFESELGKIESSKVDRVRGKYGVDSGWHVGAADWVKGQGFEPGSGLKTSGHNAGSMHYSGDALDVRIGGKSNAEIEAFIQSALKQGYNVRDERIKPSKSEQKVWGGPHIHLSKASGTPKLTRTTGGGTQQKTAPKADVAPKDKPKNSRTVNVGGTSVKVTPIKGK